MEIKNNFIEDEALLQINAPRAEYVTVKPESNIYTRFSTGKTRSFVALPKDKKKITPKPPAPGSEKQEPQGKKKKESRK
jgi:hypothetical protein